MMRSNKTKNNIFLSISLLKMIYNHGNYSNENLLSFTTTHLESHANILGINTYFGRLFQ